MDEGGGGTGDAIPAPGTHPLDARLRDHLRRAYDRGRALHGDLAVPFDAFAEHAARMAAARLARSSMEASPGRVAEVLERVALEDLLLAFACETGVPGSWERLQVRITPAIRALALRKGASAAEAAALADEIPGALACPPARGTARSRMGTFDGTGSLIAWLGTIVAHRIADLRRAPQSRSLETLLASEEKGEMRHGSATPAIGAGPDPAEEAGDAEMRRGFEDAFRMAGASLTPRERLALVLRFRDGLGQAEIARLLHVGTPRACRILQGGVGKLREWIGRFRGEGGRTVEERTWTALREAAASYLANPEPPADPEKEGASGHG